MPLKPVALTMCGLLWAAGAAAQNQITPEVFLGMANGKTLTFTDQASGNVVGVEQFINPKLSVWAERSGRCSYGHIEIRGPLVCFLYENFPNPENCWVPFEDDGELIVMSTNKYEFQRVTEVTEDPVICEGAPLS